MKYGQQVYGKEKAHMKGKKILWTAFIVLCVAGCIRGAYEVYGYYHPNVIISYRVEEAEDLYLSLPSYAIESRSYFGYAKKYEEEMREWWIPTNEMEIKLRTDYIKPIHVSSNVSVENGKTIITYNGTAVSPTGENVTIDKTVELNFIVSDNLP